MGLRQGGIALRRLILALMLVLLSAPGGFSYTIIDVNLFYAFYEKPNKVIDFTEFKDGSTITEISGEFQLNLMYQAKPDCLASGPSGQTSPEALDTIALQSDAFSDDWSFKAVSEKKPDAYCEAVLWFDQGISPGKFKLAVTATSGRSKPFVLYTNKGFLGVVPDSPSETVFIFDNISAVFLFETDFPNTSSESDQEDEILAELNMQGFKKQSN